MYVWITYWCNMLCVCVCVCRRENKNILTFPAWMHENAAITDPSEGFLRFACTCFYYTSQRTHQGTHTHTSRHFPARRALHRQLTACTRSLFNYAAHHTGVENTRSLQRASAHPTGRMCLLWLCNAKLMLVPSAKNSWRGVEVEAVVVLVVVGWDWTSSTKLQENTHTCSQEESWHEPPPSLP